MNSIDLEPTMDFDAKRLEQVHLNIIMHRRRQSLAQLRDEEFQHTFGHHLYYIVDMTEWAFKRKFKRLILNAALFLPILSLLLLWWL